MRIDAAPFSEAADKPRSYLRDTRLRSAAHYGPELCAVGSPAAQLWVPAPLRTGRPGRCATETAWPAMAWRTVIRSRRVAAELARNSVRTGAEIELLDILHVAAHAEARNDLDHAEHD